MKNVFQIFVVVTQLSVFIWSLIFIWKNHQKSKREQEYQNLDSKYKIIKIEL